MFFSLKKLYIETEKIVCELGFNCRTFITPFNIWIRNKSTTIPIEENNLPAVHFCTAHWRWREDFILWASILRQPQLYLVAISIGKFRRQFVFPFVAITILVSINVMSHTSIGDSAPFLTRPLEPFISLLRFLLSFIRRSAVTFKWWMLHCCSARNQSLLLISGRWWRQATPPGEHW